LENDRVTDSNAPDDQTGAGSALQAAKLAGDVSSMMHDNQVHIDADTIRGMIIDQFPEYRHERIEQLETTGTVYAIFRIGSGVAARFPLRKMEPVECADMLRSEAVAMTEFAKHSPVATPRPLGLGHPGALYSMPWALQSWIEGHVVTQTALRRPRRLHSTLFT
jgi:aminoglycoside phosphotransferase (APT) family kinase protein